jgi:hypothetical protein
MSSRSISRSKRKRTKREIDAKIEANLDRLRVEGFAAQVLEEVDKLLLNFDPEVVLHAISDLRGALEEEV